MMSSKTEYTNTQQGLLEEGYMISFKLDMQRLGKALGFTFAEKQLRVDP